MTDRRAEDRPDFDRLSDLIPAAGAPAAGLGGGAAGGLGRGPAARPGPASGDDLSKRLAAVWAEVVGAEVAENARPVQLRDGRLVVTTSSSAWAQTLHMMSPMIVAGLLERLGEGSVEKAVFRHAGWDVFAPLDSPTAAGAAAAAAVRKSRQTRGEQRPAPRSAPAAPAAAVAKPIPPPAAKAAPEVGAAVPSEAAAGVGGAPATAPSGGVRADDLDGLSAEEKQALADLEGLPLAPSVKQTIREAMKAAFARAKQDSGRS